jgi:large subunit ribosomal protein L25
MAKSILKVEPRLVIGRQVKNLRKQGLVPGTVFGRDVKSTSIQAIDKDFARLFKEVGETGLIYLEITGENTQRPVLVKNLQYDPRTDKRIHVDFHQVNLKEKVTANVPVEFVGESDTVKQGLGSLNESIREIEVECLPTEIPEVFEIDISKLIEIGDSIKVSDLKVASDVEIKTDLESVIVSLSEIQEEEVVEAPVTEEADTPEVGSSDESSESAPTESAESETKSE